MRQADDSVVTGIGGVFFRAREPEKLRRWYREHLGIDAGEQGVNFFWRDSEGRHGRTVWAAFARDTAYFGPGDQQLMINYRVNDLDTLLGKLRKQGVEQVGGIEKYWYGRFAWVIDGEGNRLELWEPDHFSPHEFAERMKRQHN